MVQKHIFLINSTDKIYDQQNQMLLELSSCISKEDSTTKHKQGSAAAGMIFF